MDDTERDKLGPSNHSTRTDSSDSDEVILLSLEDDDVTEPPQNDVQSSQAPPAEDSELEVMESGDELEEEEITIIEISDTEIKEELDDDYGDAEESCVDFDPSRLGVIVTESELPDDLLGEPKNGVYRCKFCPQKFRSKARLIAHIERHISNGSIRKCRFCEFYTAMTQTLREHECKHTKERPNQCDMCGFSCRLKGDLARHQLVHTSHKKYQCKVCGHRTKTAGNLRRHMERHEPDMPRKFACTLCGFAFKRHSALKSHMKRRHNDAKPFFCDQCAFRCKTMWELNNHKAKHTDDHPYHCTWPECGKTFKTKSDCTKHFKRHSGVKNFECSICSKRFFSSTLLGRHSAAHSDVRNFECAECLKKFKTLKTLQSHMLTHQIIRPFQCDVCYKTFSTQCNLNTHKRVHGVGRPYQCPICVHSSREMDHLMAHIGSEHLHNFTYLCGLCRKPFGKSFHLQLHMQRCHKEDMEGREETLVYDPDYLGLDLKPEPSGVFDASMFAKYLACESLRGLGDTRMLGNPRLVKRESGLTGTSDDSGVSIGSTSSPGGGSTLSENVQLPPVVQLARFGGIPFCLARKNSGIQLNCQKKGKKPNRWFMDVSLMTEEDAERHNEYLRKKENDLLPQKPRRKKAGRRKSKASGIGSRSIDQQPQPSTSGSGFYNSKGKARRRKRSHRDTDSDDTDEEEAYRLAQQLMLQLERQSISDESRALPHRTSSRPRKPTAAFETFTSSLQNTAAHVKASTSSTAVGQKGRSVDTVTEADIPSSSQAGRWHMENRAASQKQSQEMVKKKPDKKVKHLKKTSVKKKATKSQTGVQKTSRKKRSPGMHSLVGRDIKEEPCELDSSWTSAVNVASQSHYSTALAAANTRCWLHSVQLAASRSRHGDTVDVNNDKETGINTEALETGACTDILKEEFFSRGLQLRERKRRRDSEEGASARSFISAKTQQKEPLTAPVHSCEQTLSGMRAGSSESKQCLSSSPVEMVVDDSSRQVASECLQDLIDAVCAERIPDRSHHESLATTRPSSERDSEINNSETDLLLSFGSVNNRGMSRQVSPKRNKTLSEFLNVDKGENDQDDTSRVFSEEMADDGDRPYAPWGDASRGSVIAQSQSEKNISEDQLQEGSADPFLATAEDSISINTAETQAEMDKNTRELQSLENSVDLPQVTKNNKEEHCCAEKDPETVVPDRANHLQTEILSQSQTVENSAEESCLTESQSEKNTLNTSLGGERSKGMLQVAENDHTKNCPAESHADSVTVTSADPTQENSREKQSSAELQYTGNTSGANTFSGNTNTETENNQEENCVTELLPAETITSTATSVDVDGRGQFEENCVTELLPAETITSTATSVDVDGRGQFEENCVTELLPAETITSTATSVDVDGRGQFEENCVTELLPAETITSTATSVDVDGRGQFEENCVTELLPAETITSTATSVDVDGRGQFEENCVTELLPAETITSTATSVDVDGRGQFEENCVTELLPAETITSTATSVDVDGRGQFEENCVTELLPAETITSTATSVDVDGRGQFEENCVTELLPAETITSTATSVDVDGRGQFEENCQTQSMQENQSSSVNKSNEDVEETFDCQDRSRANNSERDSSVSGNSGLNNNTETVPTVTSHSTQVQSARKERVQELSKCLHVLVSDARVYPYARDYLHKFGVNSVSLELRRTPVQNSRQQPQKQQSKGKTRHTEASTKKSSPPKASRGKTLPKKKTTVRRSGEQRKGTAVTAGSKEHSESTGIGGLLLASAAAAKQSKSPSKVSPKTKKLSGKVQPVRKSPPKNAPESRITRSGRQSRNPKQAENKAAEAKEAVHDLGGEEADGVLGYSTGIKVELDEPVTDESFCIEGTVNQESTDTAVAAEDTPASTGESAAPENPIISGPEDISAQDPTEGSQEIVQPIITEATEEPETDKGFTEEAALGTKSPNKTVGAKSPSKATKESQKKSFFLKAKKEITTAKSSEREVTTEISPGREIIVTSPEKSPRSKQIPDIVSDPDERAQVQANTREQTLGSPQSAKESDVDISPLGTPSAAAETVPVSPRKSGRARKVRPLVTHPHSTKVIEDLKTLLQNKPGAKLPTGVKKLGILSEYYQPPAPRKGMGHSHAERQLDSDRELISATESLETSDTERAGEVANNSSTESLEVLKVEHDKAAADPSPVDGLKTFGHECEREAAESSESIEEVPTAERETADGCSTEGLLLDRNDAAAVPEPVTESETQHHPSSPEPELESPPVDDSSSEQQNKVCDTTGVPSLRPEESQTDGDKDSVFHCLENSEMAKGDDDMPNPPLQTEAEREDDTLSKSLTQTATDTEQDTSFEHAKTEREDDTSKSLTQNAADKEQDTSFEHAETEREDDTSKSLTQNAADKEQDTSFEHAETEREDDTSKSLTQNAADKEQDTSFEHAETEREDDTLSKSLTQNATDKEQDTFSEHAETEREDDMLSKSLTQNAADKEQDTSFEHAETEREDDTMSRLVTHSEVEKENDTLSVPLVCTETEKDTLSKPSIQTLTENDTLSKPLIQTDTESDTLSKPSIQTLTENDTLSKPLIQTDTESDTLSKPSIQILTENDTLSKPLIQTDTEKENYTSDSVTQPRTEDLVEEATSSTVDDAADINPEKNMGNIVTAAQRKSFSEEIQAEIRKANSIQTEVLEAADSCSEMSSEKTVSDVPHETAQKPRRRPGRPPKKKPSINESSHVQQIQVPSGGKPAGSDLAASSSASSNPASSGKKKARAVSRKQRGKSETFKRLSVKQKLGAKGNAQSSGNAGKGSGKAHHRLWKKVKQAQAGWAEIKAQSIKKKKAQSVPIAAAAETGIRKTKNSAFKITKSTVWSSSGGKKLKKRKRFLYVETDTGDMPDPPPKKRGRKPGPKIILDRSQANLCIDPTLLLPESGQITADFMGNAALFGGDGSSNGETVTSLLLVQTGVMDSSHAQSSETPVSLESESQLLVSVLPAPYAGPLAPEAATALPQSTEDCLLGMSVADPHLSDPEMPELKPVVSHDPESALPDVKPLIEELRQFAVAAGEDTVPELSGEMEVPGQVLNEQSSSPPPESATPQSSNQPDEAGATPLESSALQQERSGLVVSNRPLPNKSSFQNTKRIFSKQHKGHRKKLKDPIFTPNPQYRLVSGFEGNYDRRRSRRCKKSRLTKEQIRMAQDSTLSDLEDDSPLAISDDEDGSDIEFLDADYSNVDLSAQRQFLENLRVDTFTLGEGQEVMDMIDQGDAGQLDMADDDGDGDAVDRTVDDTGLVGEEVSFSGGFGDSQSVEDFLALDSQPYSDEKLVTDDERLKAAELGLEVQSLGLTSMKAEENLIDQVYPDFLDGSGDANGPLTDVEAMNKIPLMISAGDGGCKAEEGEHHSAGKQCDCDCDGDGDCDGEVHGENKCNVKTEGVLSLRGAKDVKEEDTKAELHVTEKAEAVSSVSPLIQPHSFTISFSSGNGLEVSIDENIPEHVFAPDLKQEPGVVEDGVEQRVSPPQSELTNRVHVPIESGVALEDSQSLTIVVKTSDGQRVLLQEDPQSFVKNEFAPNN